MAPEEAAHLLSPMVGFLSLKDTCNCTNLAWQSGTLLWWLCRIDLCCYPEQTRIYSQVTGACYCWCNHKESGMFLSKWRWFCRCWNSHCLARSLLQPTCHYRIGLRRWTWNILQSERVVIACEIFCWTCFSLILEASKI